MRDLHLYTLSLIIMSSFECGLLYDAVRNDELKKAKKLLYAKKVDPNKIPQILIHACTHGYLDMVEVLITNPSNPANVNIDCECDEDGRKGVTRPIWVAVENNNVQLLRLLLYTTKKVDLDCRKTFAFHEGNDHWEVTNTPLHHAVVRNRTAIVQELIRAGADVSARRTTKFGEGDTHTTTPLLHAVALKRFNLCRLLVKNKCDLTIRNIIEDRPMTALDVAIEENYPDYVEFLLQHLPKDADILGSAIGFAVECNSSNYIEVLLQQGYKLWVHWNPATDPCTCSDGLLHGIKLSAEVSCITLLQYGCKVDASTEHFSLAVKQGLIGLLYNMVQLNPQVLQQSWLSDCKDFGELPEKAVSWLHTIRRQPCTLKDLCKATVLTNLRPASTAESTQPHIPTLISQLPLPTLLKKFLQLTSAADACSDIGL